MSARLQTIPFFSGVSLRHLDYLGQLFRVRAYERGEIIVREGELGDAFFLISAGTVQVVSEGTCMHQRPVV